MKFLVACNWSLFVKCRAYTFGLCFLLSSNWWKCWCACSACVQYTYLLYLMGWLVAAQEEQTKKSINGSSANDTWYLDVRVASAKCARIYSSFCNYEVAILFVQIPQIPQKTALSLTRKGSFCLEKAWEKAKKQRKNKEKSAEKPWEKQGKGWKKKWHLLAFGWFLGAKSFFRSIRSRPSGAVVLVLMWFISFMIHTIIDHVSKITCDPYKNFGQWLACADVESFRTQKSRVILRKWGRLNTINKILIKCCTN